MSQRSPAPFWSRCSDEDVVHHCTVHYLLLLLPQCGCVGSKMPGAIYCIAFAGVHAVAN